MFGAYLIVKTKFGLFLRFGPFYNPTILITFLIDIKMKLNRDDMFVGNLSKIKDLKNNLKKRFNKKIFETLK